MPIDLICTRADRTKGEWWSQWRFIGFQGAVLLVMSHLSLIACLMSQPCLYQPKFVSQSFGARWHSGAMLLKRAHPSARAVNDA